MAKEPVGPWRPGHRKEAARLRELAAEATTDLVRRFWRIKHERRTGSPPGRPKFIAVSDHLVRA